MDLSPTHGNDNALQRMIHRARKAAKLTPREKLLYQLVSSQAKEAPMNPPSGQDEPPAEFVAILRMPAGQQHRLAVNVDGLDILLVLNSRGDANPEREAYLWRWLLNRVRQEDTP